VMGGSLHNEILTGSALSFANESRPILPPSLSLSHNFL
jgi:hypothetical protein